MVEQRPFKPKVVGSIPTAPTKTSFEFNEIKTLGGNKGALSHLRSQHETNDFAVCLALALFHGLAVDVHRRSDIGMAHQFLLHLERSPSLVEKAPERVAECVPADVADSAL